jgi:glycosyltransferase involved in cell wall biosynthesis
MSKQANILFLVPYPVKQAPSQRFRVELFEPCLQAMNVNYTISSFIDDKTWSILYKPGNALKKAAGIFRGYLRRIKNVLWDIHKYTHIFIHREAAPLGPPIFEWIIAKLWRKKIIYDFDDAIWIPNTGNENKMAAWLKANWKVKYICRWSHTVVTGNEYLCSYASSNTKGNVMCLPTTVDTERVHNKMKEHRHDSIIVGWTGSHSTLPFLEQLVPVLNELNKEHPFTLLVIANRKPEFDFPTIMFIPWKAETEIDDLLHADIGIMPLTDDKWSEGKCGFKLIQYLSLSIPAVASPVGVNKKIIDHGVNGYIARNEDEWKQYLKDLMQDIEKRERFGRAGREKIVKEYSLSSQQEKFLNLFN